jgi:hypothetical protein
MRNPRIKLMLAKKRQVRAHHVGLRVHALLVRRDIAEEAAVVVGECFARPE